jgi:3-hydroxyisobutyrate dehydrogenase
MARIGFIGLGNMGLPMALNLAKAGHGVAGFDATAAACGRAAEAGLTLAASAAQASEGADAVITMLPDGAVARAVWEGDGLLGALPPGALAIDCSTIDVASARHLAGAAEAMGRLMLDAPVSGGTMGAAAGTLTFMVGGTDAAFARGKPLLEAMGKTIAHAGGPGAGQAAKICNNMILGISMIAVSEAFALGEKLGLSHQALFDIASKSSGQCWSLTTYCPVPGPVPTAPSNRGYAPGFTAAMMLKDLALAQAAARDAGAAAVMGAEAEAMYRRFVANGGAGTDFSGIITMLRNA